MSDRLLLVADFNAETLARYLANTAMPGAEVTVAPFGQVYQTLAGSGPGAGHSALVWTQPGAVIDAFRRARDFEPADTSQALDQVAAFAAAISRFARQCQYVFVPTWTLPPWDRGYGMLDYRPLGVSHLLARMNLALADALSSEPAVFVLDAARWIAAAGPRAFSSKQWYASKTPFGPAVFEQAAADLAAALSGLAGRARRLIILDLDNVLWGGSVGEVGWEAITLGGPDHVGEAFADFQRALKALTSRGIQLAIASKNDDAAAQAVFEHHPEMVLRPGDFVARRINWSDKGQNVIDLLREINLGPESAVFIDDSAIERARVASAVPGVLAPDWPDDPARYREALAGLRCFDTPSITVEDRGRSRMSAAERLRQDALGEAGNVDAWLETLDIKVMVEPLVPADLARATQLLNKTNQMNMATRRLSQSELEQWAARPENLLLTFRVSDRFGDSGLTGIVGLTCEGTTARLTDFLLSCRVMGRHVEETMVHAAVAHSRSRGAQTMLAEFVPTPRNAPCGEFLRRSGLTSPAEHRYSWDLSQPYERPRVVVLEDRSGVVSSIDR